jgi:hypothetical protein
MEQGTREFPSKIPRQPRRRRVGFEELQQQSEVKEVRFAEKEYDHDQDENERYQHEEYGRERQNGRN